MILCCLSIVLLVVSSLVLRPNPFLIMRERADNSCTCISCLSLISLPPDGWSSPVVTGQAPPPCYDFTLTTVGEKRAAMFGGYSQSSFSDDLYIVDLKRHSVVSV